MGGKNRPGWSVEYYAKNPEKCRAIRKRWSDNNKDKIKKKTDRYRLANPEKILLKSAKDRSAKKGLPFDLELSDVKIPDVCPVFKVPMKFKTRFAPSLDQIVPGLGYTKSNVQVISKLANLMKNDATTSEMETFAKWILNIE